ncbi:Sec-independent protein translocase protein TatB [Alphaproteobacteria bacterium]|jgi:sec-independent protein translocase protein TatB|nr:Sec-independent protein translocase protein TatB [Alphaproteobacteria bacterium]|tara:strand:+ start:145 stop:492 length:348 start_codon:yes stop_codon:yes gene_type:complete
MLDIGWQEFILVAFVLLIVVGPKDLPKVLRTITSFIRKLKSMASDFHRGVDDLANESEISNLRNQVSTLTDNKLISSEMDEFKDLQNSDKLDVKSLKEDISNIKDISLSKNNKDT